MLRRVKIQNYALIQELEIEFYEGFSIITGETGAGKSILLGALSLVLGQRADTAVLNDKTKKCFIEIEIQAGNLKEKLIPIFEENELEFDPEIVLRREISPTGKSRAFINDSPVNLNILRIIGLQLIDIHSQHQNLLLEDTHFQLASVDIIAQNQKLLSLYQAEYRKFLEYKNKLNELIEIEKREKADFDYYDFQYKQIHEAGFYAGEQEELESERDTQTHAEEIKRTLLLGSTLILEADDNMLLNILRIINGLQQILPYYQKSGTLLERLEILNIEFKDIAREFSLQAVDIEYDATRLEFINNRLDLLYSLLQKHQAEKLDDLLKIKEELNNKLITIASYSEAIEHAAKELKIQQEKTNELAVKLSESRRTNIPKIEKEIILLLRQLGMPYAAFKIEQTNKKQLSNYGFDDVRYLFSANKNTEMQEVSKVASGGEISRMMLSLKSLLSKSVTLPTIVFDEIDTGVSGDIADKMGEIMCHMAKKLQVISITHLPQVAANAQNHYLVYKSAGKEGGFSKIKLLDTEQRVLELAKMLSGKEVTEVAKDQAKLLLKL